MSEQEISGLIILCGLVGIVTMFSCVMNVWQIRREVKAHDKKISELKERIFVRGNYEKRKN